MEGRRRTNIQLPAPPDCCAHTTRGRIIAALPRSEMNSRRLIMSSPTDGLSPLSQRSLTLAAVLCITAKLAGRCRLRATSRFMHCNNLSTVKRQLRSWPAISAIKAQALISFVASRGVDPNRILPGSKYCIAIGSSGLNAGSLAQAMSPPFREVTICAVRNVTRLGSRFSRLSMG